MNRSLMQLAAMVTVLLPAAGFANGGEPQVVYDIPRLAAVTIDGKADDWGKDGFRVEVMSAVSGRLQEPQKGDAKFRLGWNDVGLLVLVTVKDDVIVEAASLRSGSPQDSVGILVGAAQHSRSTYRVLVSPGLSPGRSKLRRTCFDSRGFALLRPKTLQFARTRIQGGYVLEALLPWRNLGLRPVEGNEIAFQLCVSDFDGHGGGTRMAWYPSDKVDLRASAMQRIRLSARAGEPVLLAAVSQRNGEEILLSVVGDAGLAGQHVELRGGEAVAASALQNVGGRAVAKLRVPASLLGDDWPGVEIAVKGRPDTGVAVTPVMVFRDPEALGRWLMASSEWRSWSLGAIAEFAEALSVRSKTHAIRSARVAVANCLIEKCLAKAGPVQPLTCAAYSYAILGLVEGQRLGKQWSGLLKRGFAPDGKVSTSLGPLEVMDLFAALHTLRGAGLSDMFAAYINEQTGWQTWPGGFLAIKCGWLLKGDAEARKSARVRIADHLQNKHLTDAAATKSVPLYCWRLFAETLGKDISPEDRKTWAAKIRAAFAGTPKARKALSAAAAAELALALAALEGNAEAKELARLWLKDRSGKPAGMLGVARLIVLGGIGDSPELIEIVEGFEKEWIARHSNSPGPPAAYEGIARAWLRSDFLGNAQDWALRSLESALSKKHFNAENMLTAGRLLVMTRCAIDGAGCDSYAQGLIELAKQDKLPGDWPANSYRYLMEAACVPDARQRLREALADEQGSPRAAIVKMLSWTYFMTKEPDKWRSFLDGKANKAEGDARSRWLVARADAEVILCYPASPIQGKKWLDGALAAAESPVCRLEVLRKIADAFAAIRRHDLALSVIASVKNQFRGEHLAAVEALERDLKGGLAAARVYSEQRRQAVQLQRKGALLAYYRKRLAVWQTQKNAEKVAQLQAAIDELERSLPAP